MTSFVLLINLKIPAIVGILGLMTGIKSCSCELKNVSVYFYKLGQSICKLRDNMVAYA